MTSVIVGARHGVHLQENLGTAGWKLVGEALQRLNEVSHLPDRYPEAMEKNMHERRDNAVNMPQRLS
jgi:diketogulonate reductase-like aldo/keto reductase